MPAGFRARGLLSPACRRRIIFLVAHDEARLEEGLP